MRYRRHFQGFGVMTMQWPEETPPMPGGSAEYQAGNPVPPDFYMTYEQAIDPSAPPMPGGSAEYQAGSLIPEGFQETACYAVFDVSTGQPLPCQPTAGDPSGQGTVAASEAACKATGRGEWYNGSCHNPDGTPYSPHWAPGAPAPQAPQQAVLQPGGLPGYTPPAGTQQAVLQPGGLPGYMPPAGTVPVTPPAAAASSAGTVAVAAGAGILGLLMLLK